MQKQEKRKPRGAKYSAAVREFIEKLTFSRAESDDSRRTAILTISKNAAIFIFSLSIASAKLALATYPLGLAFLSSASAFVPAIYSGCVIGAALSGYQGAVYITAYTAVFLLRALISRYLSPDADGGELPRPVARRGGTRVLRLEIPKRLSPSAVLFAERIYLRMTVGCGAGFGIGIWRIISGGFRYYDLFGAIFLIAVCPFFVFLFSGIFCERDSKAPYFEAGAALVAFAAISAMGGFSVAGLRLDVALAFVLTLLTSKLGGGLRAGVLGLVAGLAIDPICAPVFGAAGLLSSLLWRYSCGFSISASVAAATTLGVCAEGIGAAITLLPELALGGAVTLPLLKSGLLARLSLFNSKPKAAPEYKNPTDDGGRRRFSDLSDAVSALSDSFRVISGANSRPSESDFLSECHRVCGDYCEKCSMRNLCWEGASPSGEEMLSLIAGQLCARGRASSSALPDHILRRCFRAGRIVEESNRRAAELLRASLKNDTARLFSLDCSAMAELIESVADKSAADISFDYALSDALREALSRSEFSAETVGVYGRERHTVIARGISLVRTKISSDLLHKIAQNVLGEALSEPEYSIDGDRVCVYMKSERVLRAQHASASYVKAGSEMSGDTRALFESRDGYCYSLISDGMGSGSVAAAASKTAADVLQKLLCAGVAPRAAARLISVFLQSGREECSVGVDLCEIDLIRSRARFLKCGAAPSFIRRGGKLFDLESKTFPIGILDTCDGEELTVSLEPEDVIIMFSDGVAQSFDDGAYLMTLFEEDWDDDLEQMAEKIAALAHEVRRGADDITVTLVRVSDISEPDKKEIKIA